MQQEKAAKTTFVQKIRTKNVDEIDTCNQFHQHFTRGVLPIFWRQKISNPKHSFVIFGTKIWVQNALINC